VNSLFSYANKLLAWYYNTWTITYIPYVTLASQRYAHLASSPDAHLLYRTLLYIYITSSKAHFCFLTVAKAKLNSVLHLQCYQLLILQQKKDKLRTIVHKEQVQNEQVGKQWKGWITVQHGKVSSRANGSQSKKHVRGRMVDETCN